MDSVFSERNNVLPSLEAATATEQKYSWKFWTAIAIVVVLFLAYIGFNVFNYLAKGTQATNELLVPIFQNLGLVAANTTKQVITTSAEGTKTLGNAVVAGSTNVQTGANVLLPPNQASLSNALQTPVPVQVPPPAPTASGPSTSQQQQPNYVADNSYSSIQPGNTSGWCFIGEDSGFRTCASVGEADMCMSGNIFPSQAICINPTLRA